MSKPVSRTVKTSFWEDEKIVEQFSPEDKYFFLYLLTNPHTTQLGIYPLVQKTVAYELGYSKEAVAVLLDRFENKYNIIKYSPETSEVAVKNFLIHSIIKGGKPVLDCLTREIHAVKNINLISYIYNNLINHKDLNDTVIEFLSYIAKEYYMYLDNNIKNNDNERIVDDSLTIRGTNRGDVISEDREEAEQFFETCWKEYPKKKGKASISLTKKKYLLKKVGLEQMLRCIERYKEYVKGKDLQYVKDGSTFFNSGYVDYLDTNVESSTGETVVIGGKEFTMRTVHGRKVYVDKDGKEWR